MTRCTADSLLDVIFYALQFFSFIQSVRRLMSYPSKLAEFENDGELTCKLGKARQLA